MTRTIPLARYLFTRLKQQNVDTVYGVPGDFTLKALDQLPAAGLKWIGCCNELNAGYAADGYARIRGLGALFNTYGVGELSAINAVAGSYAEHVPVVHIVGAPPRRLQDMSAWDDTARQGLRIHHTLAVDKSSVFRELAGKVTVAQANLDVERHAAEKIDKIISKCLALSLPVYVELPSDMVSAEVDAERLEQPISLANLHSPREINNDAERLLRRLYSAVQPMILVDRGDGVSALHPEINELARLTGIPTLSMPSAPSSVDNSLENYYGVHSGPVGEVDTMAYVNSADLVLAFGPQFSDTQTLGWATVPGRDKMVILKKSTIGDVETDTREVLRRILKVLEPERISHRNANMLGRFREAAALSHLSPGSGDAIDQTRLYHRLNKYLRPNDVILVGNGTPVIGCRDFVLPSGSQFIASGVWYSIGHMLPAALGAALAEPNQRTILLEGDGNFQVTAQELSTIIHNRLNITIFIMNNGGYAFERLIHGLREPYNDIAPWRYTEAARFFGAPDGYPVENHRVETWADLDRLFETDSFHDGKGLKMVEIVLDKYDVPDKFREVCRRAGEMV